ncbi:MAG: NAD(P)-dependent oxidoreductase [Spirochaetales bacterium]|nr:NAD(P)-dependent oxidoreductase [Spirochaetales bacterium]
MKVLIADKISKDAISSLKQDGIDITIQEDLTADKLPEIISDFQVLVVRSTKVKSETIENGKKLSLIIRAGAGVNTIDIETASKLGVYVANCPGKNTAAVAELTMGLIIASDRQIANCTIDLRNGLWNKKKYSKACGLKGRTIGLIGLGSIGKAVAIRAKSFGINVAAWSRSLTREQAEKLGIEFCATPIDAAKISDIISIHLASSESTRHIINSDFFNEMKDGAIFVNTSRGEIVDTKALKEAINTKNIKAALDVYEQEPSAQSKNFEDNDLAKMITGTHHIGASTVEASESIAAEVVRIIKSYIETGTPPNSVNLRDKQQSNINLVIRHFNHVGVLANVLDEIKAAGINIEEMQNNIFKGGEAAVCTIKIDKNPEEELINKIINKDFIINVAKTES